MSRAFLLLGAVAACVVVVGNVVALTSTSLIPLTWTRWLSFEPQAGVAGVVGLLLEVGVALLALCAAWRSYRRGAQTIIPLAWTFIFLSSVAAGFIDLLHPGVAHLQGTLRGVLIVGAFAPLLVASLAAASVDIWSMPRSRAYWLAGVVLFLTNPLSEAWKHHLTHDPGNYTFTAFGQPWQFSAHAWRLLQITDTIQETTELVAALLLVIALTRMLDHRRGSSLVNTSTFAGTVKPVVRAPQP